MDVALQSSVWVTSPEFSGWLLKRGFHWRKLWKKRWIALHGSEIVYMEKEPTLENSADIVITKCQLTAATVVDKEDVDGNPFGFAIHINDGHSPTWYLRADSLREKKSWLMRLNHVMTIVRWLEDFEKVRVLGVGGTGIVYELLHKSDGRRFAMKEMEIKNRTQMEMATTEAEMLKEIMENISHPNIMHIEKVFQVGSKFYLVFPLCTGGELYDHVIRRGHFTEHDAAVIMRDLVSGLHALHSHDILHLDIKPENILFDTTLPDAKIKITDFGLSQFRTSGQQEQKPPPSLQELNDRLKAFQETGNLSKEKLRGTVGYMSPELILAGYNCKATDVFAVGVVLFILLCGRPPFHSKSNREVLEKSARCCYSMEGDEWKEVSPEAKDLVSRMLVMDANTRITTQEILDHPWLNMDEFDENALDKNSVTVGSGASLVKKSARSTVNLSQALHLLSTHVQDLKVEKLATSFSRLISSLAGAQKSRSYLSQFIRPAKPSPSDPNGEATFKYTAERIQKALESKPEDMLAMQTPTMKRTLMQIFQELGDEHGRLSMTQFGCLLMHLVFGTMNVVDPATINDADPSNSDSTSGVTLANSSPNHSSKSVSVDSSSAVGSGSGRPQSVGRLGSSHLSAQKTRPTYSLGLPDMLLCRFVDRDRDGMISLDDMFSTQALIMQKSEVFLKLVFRLYVEGAWYPGRQLNYLHLAHNLDRPAASSSGSSVLGESFEEDVVEPPKFITAKNVQNVFTKLGFDPEGGREAFITLCGVLRKQNDRRRESSLEEPEPSPLSLANDGLSWGSLMNESVDVPSESARQLQRECSSENSKIDSNSNNNSRATSVDKSRIISHETFDDLKDAKMDWKDFVSSSELDNVLIQVPLVNINASIHELVTRVEIQGPQGDDSVTAGSLLELELVEALKDITLLKSAQDRSFPIAKAFGRASLTALFGLAQTVKKGASVIREATRETYDHNTNQQAPALGRPFMQQQYRQSGDCPDDDDNDENGTVPDIEKTPQGCDRRSSFSSNKS